MAEMKVRVIDHEPKSTQEVEKELLEKHEEQFVDGETNKEEKVEGAEVSASTEEDKPSLSDGDVLSYIGKRYGKEIDSLDQLFEERDNAADLPEDVAAYFKYKKETGRTIEDFVKLNKDFDKANPDELLANYYKSTDEYLDDEDISDMLEDFDYDEDLDDEKEIKKKKLAKKKAVSTARKFFEEQKEQYKVPLESRKANDPEADKEMAEFKIKLQEAKAKEERISDNREIYLKNVKEVFNDDFKGFDFEIDDQTLSFTPAGVEELQKSNGDITNWVKNYLNESGEITNHKGFHKALAIANYPDKFARFFYEKGKADAVTTDAKNTKNIDYSTTKSPEVSSKGGMQIKAVTATSDGNRLKIRKRK
jgi:hypothetical protein